MTDAKSPTRAELLERCKAAGLHATAWKKERMAAELARLAGAAPGDGPPDDAEARRPEAGDEQGQGGGETTADENPASSPRLTGWCAFAPPWSHQHEACPGHRGARDCACPCHAEGWSRPPAPEGARLSKFNPEVLASEAAPA